jgi:hypothetical protein
MKSKLYKTILWIGFIIASFCFNFWDKYWFADFYIGNAVYVAILSFVLKKQNPKSFICYLIFCGAVNNLIDECFFKNDEIGINEYVAIACVLPVWYLKKE